MVASTTRTCLEGLCRRQNGEAPTGWQGEVLWYPQGHLAPALRLTTQLSTLFKRPYSKWGQEEDRTAAPRPGWGHHG